MGKILQNTGGGEALMRIHTIHKKYDGQYISTGNVISDQQYSMFIRGYKRKECNGFVNEDGHLQQWDLNNWPSRYLPSSIRERVKKYASGKESIILYCIRHFNGKNPVILGWIITDYNYNLLERSIIRWDEKSLEVIGQVTKAVTKNTIGEEVKYL